MLGISKELDKANFVGKKMKRAYHIHHYCLFFSLIKFRRVSVKVTPSIEPFKGRGVSCSTALVIRKMQIKPAKILSSCLKSKKD